MNLYDLLVAKKLSGGGGGGGGSDYYYQAVVRNDQTVGFLRLTFGEAAEEIPTGLFQWNGNIGEIIIGDATKVLRDDCLKQMSGVEKIEIGSGVTRIGSQAFYSDSKLKTIIIHATTPPTLTDSTAFDSIASDYVVYVPSESLATYQRTSNWSSIRTHMQAIP